MSVNATHVTWCPSRLLYTCNLCGQGFSGYAGYRGDRGSFPARNRARGNAIRHLNVAHPQKESAT